MDGCLLHNSYLACLNNINGKNFKYSLLFYVEFENFNNKYYVNNLGLIVPCMRTLKLLDTAYSRT